MIVQDRLEWGRLVIIAAIVVRLGATAALAQPGISSLSARQHYPWNGLVDVDCVVEGEEDALVLVDVVVADLDGNTNLPTRTVSGTRVVAPGEHRLVWNADADILNDAEFTNLSVIATASIGAGLVSYYPLDAHGRDVISGHDLGNWESLSDFTWARGLSGDPMGCADFNGAVAANPTGLAITNSFTISFWAKASGGLGSFVEERGSGNYGVIGASYPYVVFPAQGNGDYAGVGIAVGTNGLAVVEHSDGWFPATLITNITVGTRWNHFALTVNESGAPSVYMNGKLVRTGKASTKTNLLGVGSCVGGDAYGHYEGMLDNLLIYDRALSADEIQQLADTPLGSRKVVFDPGEGGVDESSRVYVPGDQYGELPKAKRSGYLFKGWCRDPATIVKSSWSVVSNETLVALYEIEPPYMVIDLTSSLESESVISYLFEEPEDGWQDEHKTTKLVLRKIEKGTNAAGITLTNDIWMCIFEVTQKQFELVTGSNASTYKNDKFPVSDLPWGWCKTFCERLKEKCGIEFELPKVDVWCYAGQGSETTEPSIEEYGRYSGNVNDGKGGSSTYTEVGLYKPNSWGLYDFRGNVAEWTQEVSPFILGGGGQCSDVRGGSWKNDSRYTTCAKTTYYHVNAYFGKTSEEWGFRVMAWCE